MHKGMNQYTTMAGVLGLTEQISDKYEVDYGVLYNP